MNDDTRKNERQASVKEFVRDALRFKLHQLYPELDEKPLTDAVGLIVQHMKDEKNQDRSTNPETDFQALCSLLREMGFNAPVLEIQIKQIELDILNASPDFDTDTGAPHANGSDTILWHI